jgi:hypothetical protein
MIKAAKTPRSPQYRIFAAGDELGDGTAAEASLNVMTLLLKEFSGQPKVLSIISSHLDKLTRQRIPRLKNFRINAERKLEEGINSGNIAMEIFEKYSNTHASENSFSAILAKEIPRKKKPTKNLLI